MSRRTPSQRLLERLTAMGVPIEDDAVIVRTHAGHWQRSQGAWVWRVESGPYRCPKEPVGSHHPVTELLRGRLVADWDKAIQEWIITPLDPTKPPRETIGLTTLIENEG